MLYQLRKTTKPLFLFKTFATVLFLAIPATPGYAQAKPADIPIAAFANLPTFTSPKMSPSGNKLAFLIEQDGRKQLLVQNMDGSGKTMIPPKGDTEYSYFFWKSDDVIIYSLFLTKKREYVIGRSRETRAMSVNLSTGKFVWLGQPDQTKSTDRRSTKEIIRDNLVDDPDHILLQLDFGSRTDTAVYKVNVINGKRETTQQGARHIYNWFADEKGQVRLGLGYKGMGGDTYHAIYRASGGDWVTISDMGWYNDDSIEGFVPGKNLLYVYAETPEGTTGIYTLDPLSGTLIDKVFALPGHDVEGIYHNPRTGKTAGVYYTDDYSRIHYFDKDLAAVQHSIDSMLPEAVNYIIDKSLNKNLYIILSESDRNPGYFFLYNSDNKQLIFLTKIRPDINEAIMSPTVPVQIPVRDGTTIPGYMTVPYGKAAKNLPTVILPHGGPQARDSAEWDYMAQLYASRGWLVLKPNFRGSEGYGPNFKEKGYNQWGGLMQDDVTDATKWLIQEGIADSNRICIVGWSYGGYAALMGVIKEQGLYKCAVSINGVTDLVKLKTADDMFLGTKDWLEKVGLEGAGDKDVSPYHRAKDVSAPVLLIASRTDARIPSYLSRDMDKRLRSLKKVSKYIELDEGTHYLNTQASRLPALAESEKFLKKYLD